MDKKRRSGFTLPEVLLASAIGVSVFFALGTVLTRSFSVWYNGMAQWKLAQHARITRVRLLDGGFSKGSGILSSKNVEVEPYGSWTRINYFPVYSGIEHSSYGWPSDSSYADLFLQTFDNSQPSTWAYAQSVKYYGGEQPDVKINKFTAEMEDDQTLEMTYTLHFEAAGRTFEMPQTVRAILLNADD